jgi:hypothetical protein
VELFFEQLEKQQRGDDLDKDKRGRKSGVSGILDPSKTTISKTKKTDPAQKVNKTVE